MHEWRKSPENEQNMIVYCCYILICNNSSDSYKIAPINVYIHVNDRITMIHAKCAHRF